MGTLQGGGGPGCNTGRFNARTQMKPSFNSSLFTPVTGFLHPVTQMKDSTFIWLWALRDSHELYLHHSHIIRTFIWTQIGFNYEIRCTG